MTNTRFFYYGKNNRHVVMSTQEAQDGKLSVRWVMLNPRFEGSKRGARPKLDFVSVADLTEVSDADVVSRALTVAGEPNASSN